MASNVVGSEKQSDASPIKNSFSIENILHQRNNSFNGVSGGGGSANNNNNCVGITKYSAKLAGNNNNNNVGNSNNNLFGKHDEEKQTPER